MGKAYDDGKADGRATRDSGKLVKGNQNTTTATNSDRRDYEVGHMDGQDGK